ncbi:hypothetical protein Tco_0982046 [Tanacetum coccineum]
MEYLLERFRHHHHHHHVDEMTCLDDERMKTRRNDVPYHDHFESNVVNHSETEITSDSNIIPYSQYVIESQQAAIQNSNSSAQQDALILSVIEQLKTQVANYTKINLENKRVNDTLTVELERYKEQVKVLNKGQNVDLKNNDNVSNSCAQSVFFKSFLFEEAPAWKPKLYVGDIIEKTNPIVISDSEETLILAEESRSKMLLKQQDPMMLENKVNTTQHQSIMNSVNSPEPTLSSRPTKVEVPKELPKNHTHSHALKRMGVRTNTKACFRDEIIPFVKALKDLFNTFNQYLVDELSEVQNVFHQMEQAVEQHRLESKTFEVKMNQVLNENERLLEQVLSKDIVNIIVNSSVNNASVNVHECEKCLQLETELQTDFIEKEIYDKLFKSFTTLEKHCISLEVDSQLNQEIFQRDNPVSNQRVKPSTSASGSQPSGNTKKDKIRKTLVGNACPLTRITTTTEVHRRKPPALENETPKPVVTLVYSRKPRKSKTNVPISKSKVPKSISANKKEPSQSWGSKVSDVPSSSFDECMSSKLFSSIWTPAAPSI